MRTWLDCPVGKGRKLCSWPDVVKKMRVRLKRSGIILLECFPKYEARYLCNCSLIQRTGVQAGLLWWGPVAEIGKLDAVP